jgi:uncharacterized iron-regulated membrane protein
MQERGSLTPKEDQAALRGFKGGVRQSMSWLHTWVGLLLSVVLYFMFITGSAGYFHYEITDWMQPERYAHTSDQALNQTQLLERAVNRLKEKMPNAREWYISFPSGDREHRTLSVFAAPNEKAAAKGIVEFSEELSPATGQPYPALRATSGGGVLYAMHYSLHYMPYEVAIYIVGLATMFMLIAIITGIVVHKKIFADFFTFRSGKGQRSWLDAHNVSSMMALPFFVMITYSGLLFYTYDYMPSIYAALYGTGPAAHNKLETELGYAGNGFYERPARNSAAPLISLPILVERAQQRWSQSGIEGSLESITVINPGDAKAAVSIRAHRQGTVDLFYPELWLDGLSGEILYESTPSTIGAERFSGAMFALHEGKFAAIGLRWLYFFSGLLGAAMIATGLILWVKKRKQQLRANEPLGVGLAFVERINVGLIVGLPIGVAAYFWANRLIPMQWVSRDVWEINTLFIVWAMMFGHSLLRKRERVWPEQLMLASLAFGLIPLINAISTDTHLLRSLADQQWVYAGFDLFALAAGSIWAAVYLKLRSKGRNVQTQASDQSAKVLHEPGVSASLKS